MSTYFSKFPNITYNNVLVRDITRRTKFIEENLSNPYVFLPYTVKDGEKPEDVAFYYYGSVEYTWLVLLANNIYDPYSEWPQTDEDFNQYLIEKYSEISGRAGYEVINWLQNETTNENIAYYYYNKEAVNAQVTFTGIQIQELLNNQIVTVAGIDYELVGEE